MKISKVTTNKAARLGMFIESLSENNYEDQEGPEVWVYEFKEDDEPIAIYANTDDGLFFKCGLNNDISEECPYWIDTEQKLRDLLPRFKQIMQ